MIAEKSSEYRTRTDGHFVYRSGGRERRSGVERRRFLYEVHSPERRVQVDRRSGAVRESLIDVATAR
jgi:hypothetical protein